MFWGDQCFKTFNVRIEVLSTRYDLRTGTLNAKCTIGTIHIQVDKLVISKINNIKLFLRNWTAVKLQQDFDALCEMLSEFSSGHICACYWGLGHFHLDGANLQTQTHLVSKIIHQNLVIILWQFNYGKNSFIVLVDPDFQILMTATAMRTTMRVKKLNDISNF